MTLYQFLNSLLRRVPLRPPEEIFAGIPAEFVDVSFGRISAKRPPPISGEFRRAESEGSGAEQEEEEEEEQEAANGKEAATSSEQIRTGNCICISGNSHVHAQVLL